MKRFLLKILSGMFIAGLLASCQSVPFSGRSQLIMTSEGEEIQMGNKAWQELKSQYPISHEKKYSSAVKRVGKNIAAVADKPNYNWEFLLFNNPQPNAFCLPGGKIGVFSGLFKFAANDAELAAVVGHEVGHAVARHGGERISHAQLQTVGQQLLASTVKSNVKEWMTAYGIVSQVGVTLPYSRTHEYESDYLGLIYMAKAGYNPRAALQFWDKFSKLSQTGTLGEYLSTHPMGSKRLAEMEAKLPEAMQYYNKAPVKRGYGVRY